MATRYRRMNFHARKRSSGIDGYTVTLCLAAALFLIWTGTITL